MPVYLMDRVRELKLNYVGGVIVGAVPVVNIYGPASDACLMGVVSVSEDVVTTNVEPLVCPAIFLFWFVLLALFLDRIFGVLLVVLEEMWCKGASLVDWQPSG